MEVEDLLSNFSASLFQKTAYQWEGMKDPLKEIPEEKTNKLFFLVSDASLLNENTILFFMNSRLSVVSIEQKVRLRSNFEFGELDQHRTTLKNSPPRTTPVYLSRKVIEKIFQIPSLHTIILVNNFFLSSLSFFVKWLKPNISFTKKNKNFQRENVTLISAV